MQASLRSERTYINIGWCCVSASSCSVITWACVMDCEVLLRYLLSYLYTAVELEVTLFGRCLGHLGILLVSMHSIGGHGGKF